MTTSRTLILIGSVMLLGGRGFGASPEVKGQVTPAWQVEKPPVRIPMQQARTFELPPIAKKAGQLTVLRLQARLDTEGLAGWNKNLSLEINGSKVYSQAAGSPRNGPGRTLNRDPEWVPEGFAGDYVLFRGNELCVVFSPSFEMPEPRLAHEGADMYWYVLDVSDLIREVDGNSITLGNTAQAKWFGDKNRDIVIGDLTVGYLPEKATPPATTQYRVPAPTVANIDTPAIKAGLTREGGLQVNVAGGSYLLETELSWPKGAYNHLSCGARPQGEAADEWRVEEVKAEGDRATVKAAGKSYRLARTIQADGNRLRVRDEITNLSGEDLGLELGYVATAAGPLQSLYLAGNSDPALTFVDPAAENPTVFLAQETGGLGWLAEDDVLRVQLRQRYENGAARMYSQNFGLPAGGSYAVEWTAYSVPSGDYWDMVNQIRRDWDVNFKLDGPLHFVGHVSSLSGMTVEQLRERIGKRKVALAPLHPWTAYQYPYSREDHARWWKQAQAKLHELDPQMKCLVMMEPPLESRVFAKDVDKDPYRDAMVIGADGKPCFDTYYGPIYVGKKDHDEGWRLAWRYPTLTNSWMKYLEHDVDFAMDTCGADGMYIDCFSYAFSRSWARYTYDRWDQHTVELDPKTHVITRKLTDCALVSSPAQQRIVELIQAKGGTVVANSLPATRNMRQVKCLRFTETGGGPRNSCCTHLYTPLALGRSWGWLAESERNAKGFMADVRGNVDFGALYYYYGIPTSVKFGAVDNMFPFTPIELHAGTLIGQERIITTKSGSFGWGDASTAKCLRFGPDGSELPASFELRKTERGNVYGVELGKDELAILVREM